MTSGGAWTPAAAPALQRGTSAESAAAADTALQRALQFQQQHVALQRRVLVVVVVFVVDVTTAYVVRTLQVGRGRRAPNDMYVQKGRVYIGPTMGAG